MAYRCDMYGTELEMSEVQFESDTGLIFCTTCWNTASTKEEYEARDKWQDEWIRTGVFKPRKIGDEMKWD